MLQSGADGEEEDEIFDEDDMDGLEINVDDLLSSLGEESGDVAVGNALLSELSKKLSDSSKQEETTEDRADETINSGTNMWSWKTLKDALRKKGIASEGAANKAVLLRRLETNGASLIEEEIPLKRQHNSPQAMIRADGDQPRRRAACKYRSAAWCDSESDSGNALRGIKVDRAC